MNFCKKRFLTLILAGALALGYADLGRAAGFGGPDGGNWQPGYGAQISPQDAERARKIFDESYSEMAPIRQALSAKRAELDALLASPNPDKNKIEALSREIGELRGKMLAARVDVRAKMAREGLPADYFGPNTPPPPPDGNWPGQGGWQRGPCWQGGPGWHHGGHWGRHGGGHWGRMPMMGGPCWR